MSNIHQRILKKHKKETTELNPVQNVFQKQEAPKKNIFSTKNTLSEPKTDELLERYQEYNSSEDIINFNIQKFPTKNASKSLQIPLSVFIKPFGTGYEEIQGVDLINTTETEKNQLQEKKNKKKDVPRCSKCRAYVNPFFQFLENGYKMKCNLCGHIDNTPLTYYKGIDSNGIIKGFENSPELYSGSVEFIVNEDYSARTPKEPTYFFLIDISKSSYEANIPYYSIYAIKDAVVNGRFNGGKACSFGIGFFDTSIHLLDLGGKKPKLFTLGEINGFNYSLPKEKFLIFLEDFDCEEIAEKLQIAYDGLSYTDNEAGLADISNVIKFTNNLLTKQGGKIMLIVGNNKEYMPIVDSKDKTNRHFFSSNNNAFSKLSTDLNKNMASVEMYCFGHKKMKNLASLSENIRLSGSTLSYYEDVNEDSMNKFFNDLIFNISKKSTWEAVFRIRCSKGWKKVSYGNYYGTPYNDLLRVQNIDENYSIMYTFEPDDSNMDLKNKNDSEYFFLQTSLLYTNENRQRRIRVHNYVLPTTSKNSEIYESLNIQTTLSTVLKQNLVKILSKTSLVDLQVELINQMKLIFSKIAHKTDLQFQTDNLPYLAMGFLGLLKNIVFQGQYINNFKNNSVDMLTYYRLILNNAPSDIIFKNINPTLFDLSEIGQNYGIYNENEEFIYPPVIRLSIEEVEKTKFCLLDDGFNIFFYIIDFDYVNEIGLFENESFSEDGISNSLEGQGLRNLISELRAFPNSRYLFLYVVLPDEQNFFLSIFSKLLEDKANGFGFTHSYYEFYQTYIKGVSKVF